jgi:hypothetical protein
MSSRPSTSGMGTRTTRSKRPGRTSAGSRTSRRLVAAITTICAGKVQGGDSRRGRGEEVSDRARGGPPGLLPTAAAEAGGRRRPATTIRSQAGAPPPSRTLPQRLACRSCPLASPNPSISVSSWLTVWSRSSLPWEPPRMRPTASISSMKTMQGASERACRAGRAGKAGGSAARSGGQARAPLLTKSRHPRMDQQQPGGRGRPNDRREGCTKAGRVRADREDPRQDRGWEVREGQQQHRWRGKGGKRGWGGAHRLEQVPHAPCSHSHKHFHKLRGVQGQEGHASLAGHRPACGQQEGRRGGG